MPQTFCFSADTPHELEERYKTIGSFHPTLGIIFSSVALGIPELVAAVQPLGIPVFGCSTAGEILVERDEDPFREQSAACCFLDFDPALFQVSLFGRGPDSCHALGERIGRWGRGLFAKPAFIIGIAGLRNDGEAILKGILAGAGGQVPVFGGVAGDDWQHKDTMVFSREGISHDGAVALVFDAGRIEISGIVSSGWTGIGAEMLITSSKGNTVYTINGRPATEVFKEYLNVKDKDLFQVGISFPLQIRRPDGTTVLRAFLSGDFTEGSLTFAGSVPEGSRVRFSSSFGYETIEQSIKEMEEYRRDHPDASLLLLFSCLARYRVAGPMTADEVLAASRIWQAPLVGLFTYGEIGYNRLGSPDFFNESLSLVLISLRK